MWGALALRWDTEKTAKLVGPGGDRRAPPAAVARASPLDAANCRPGAGFIVRTSLHAAAYISSAVPSPMQAKEKGAEAPSHAHFTAGSPLSGVTHPGWCAFAPAIGQPP